MGAVPVTTSPQETSARTAAPARGAVVRGTSASPLSVLVVDDHPVVRDGVGLLLGKVDGFVLLGGAETGAEALARAADLRPDVVLLDLRLPDLPADEVVTRLIDALPAVKVVIFTAYGDTGAVRSALSAGAHGVLLKDAGTTDLVRAIRRVAAGDTVLDERLTSASAATADALARTGVTPRELDVLRLVALGRTNPEVAEALHLARNTVKTYLQSAMGKLGARNRVEAIARASEAGLL